MWFKTCQLCSQDTSSSYINIADSVHFIYLICNTSGYCQGFSLQYNDTFNTHLYQASIGSNGKSISYGQNIISSAINQVKYM